MLQALRGKYSMIFIKALLVLITIAFSFWGIETYMMTPAGSGLAKVGSTEITRQEFDDQYNKYIANAMRMSGGAMDASFFNTPEAKARYLDQMIDRQVLIESAGSLGLAVPTERLRKDIAAIPAFQADGAFSPERYKMVLEAQRMSPASFEQMMREDLLVTALPKMVTDTALVTDAQIDDELRRQGQKRDLRYVKLAKPAVDAGAAIADADIDAYYQAHSTEFMEPERVSLEYVELKAADLKVDETPDDAVLKERYEKAKNRFVSSEQRQASHLLVKVDGKGGPDEQKAALAKAEELRASIEGGKPFAEVAKANSADLGSRNQGGDLGWIEKGTTDEAFEAALFALQKGELSKPVLSGEGYHLIQLRELRPGATRSFEEVKAELLKEYQTGERERLYSERAGRLTDLTYREAASLEPAAKELGLQVQHTPLVARSGGEGLAANPAVIKAAFSDAVLVQKNNSDPIEIGPEHVVVVRVAEHKPATPKPLETVREQVKGRLIAERSAKDARVQADASLAELRKSGDLAALAAAKSLSVETQKGVGRDAAALDAAIVQAAFAMPRPAGGKPAYRLVSLGNDTYALVALDAVTDGDPKAADATTREATRNTLAQRSSDVATRELIAALRQGIRIKKDTTKLVDTSG